jgi:hypothetical protein
VAYFRQPQPGRPLVHGRRTVQCGEVMIPYFGHHSSKQFIHGKPIRYSYKVWALWTRGRSGVWFEPYLWQRHAGWEHGAGPGAQCCLAAGGEGVPAA